MLALPRHEPSREHGEAVQLDLRLGGSGGERRLLAIGAEQLRHHHLPRMLERLLQAADGSVWSASAVCRPRADLGWHRRFAYADAVLHEAGPWRVVLLEAAVGAVGAEALRRDLGHYLEQVHASEARPLLLEPWPDLEDQTDPRVDLLAELAGDGGAELVPLRRCWRRVREERPELELLAADGRHPSYTGSLLSAAAIAHAIAGRLPDVPPSGLGAGGFGEAPLAGDDLHWLLETAAAC